MAVILVVTGSQDQMVYVTGLASQYDVTCHTLLVHPDTNLASLRHYADCQIDAVVAIGLPGKVETKDVGQAVSRWLKGCPRVILTPIREYTGHHGVLQAGQFTTPLCPGSLKLLVAALMAPNPLDSS